jgi:hypothetical protein
MHRIMVILVILTPIKKNLSQVFLKVRAYSCYRDLRNRITAAVVLVNRDMLTRVWDEMDYRIDVCRISKGGYIEQL